MRLFQPLYGSHQASCSTNKHFLQISPATVYHFSFIYNVFNLIIFFCVCVCVLKKNKSLIRVLLSKQSDLGLIFFAHDFFVCVLKKSL